MKRWNFTLALIALVLVLGSTLHGAMAYFTTYIIADGGYPLRLGSNTEITEEVSNWTKHVTVVNNQPSSPVYVRAKAFCGSLYTLEFDSPDGKWTLGEDGYYYYSDILAPGESTSELNIRIGNVPEDVTDGTDFHVIVVYETTPVLYHEDGTPYADWNVVLDNGTGGGGAP